MTKDKLYFIIIGVLLIFTLFFGYKWYFAGDSASAERIKTLEEEFKILEEKKKQSEQRELALRKGFDSLQVKNDSIEEQIVLLIKEAEVAERVADSSNENLKKMMEELKATRKKIEELKANPPFKKEEDLLESIKNKVQ